MPRATRQPVFRRHPKGKICSILVRGINRHIHAQFKAYCSRRGLGMNDVIREHIHKLAMIDGQAESTGDEE